MKIFRFSLFAILTSAFIFQSSSCRKDKDYPNPSALIQDIVGTWTYHDGDYRSTLIFAEDQSGQESFIDDPSYGVAEFYWSFLDQGTLNLRYGGMWGDFQAYNDIEDIEALNEVEASVERNGNKLILTHEGEQYIYDWVPESELLTKDFMEGTWVTEEDNRAHGVSFYIMEDKAADYGAIYTATEDDTNVSEHWWKINGNMVFFSGQYQSQFGSDYKFGPHELGDGFAMIAKRADASLTFTLDGEDLEFSRAANDYSVSWFDLENTYWVNDQGGVHEVIAFNQFAEGYVGKKGRHAFRDGNQSGACMDLRWTVCSDIVAIERQSYVLGDYLEYFEAQIGEPLFLSLELTSTQLSLIEDGQAYTFERMSEDDIYSDDDLYGTWVHSENGYNDTVRFLAEKEGSNSFSDGASKGSTSMKWSLIGDLMLVEYYDMTGDYESYYQIEGATTIQFKVVGSELTFIDPDGNITYDKQ